MNELVEGVSFSLVLFCGLLGAIGQCVRVSIGLYKLHMDKTVDTISNFDYKRLLVSVIIGMMIGMLISLIYHKPLSNTDILGIISASYAGTDWLEGFLSGRSSNVK